MKTSTVYQKDSTPQFEAGLDVKYGLTSNLTLDLTLNTDFAQVEADDQQINLTRFSLFFPEKRLFFQERSSNFEFNLGGPNRLFYSRQIGLYDEKPVRIYGGARLVGRMGAWDVGFLSMQTAPIEDQPGENFSVLRLRHRVFNPYSYVGGIMTSRLGLDGSYNLAYGLDGIFRLFGDDCLAINWAQTFEDELKNNLLSLEPSRMRLSWERRTSKGLAYDLTLSRAGAVYNPSMGFEERENYTRFGNKVAFGWIPGKGSPLFRHQLKLAGFAILRNSDRSCESAELGPGWDFELKSGCSGGVAVKLFYEGITEAFQFSDDITEVPIGIYTFYGTEARFSIPYGKRLGADFNLYGGSFFDGWRVSVGISPRWSISNLFELTGIYQLNWIDFSERGQKLVAHIARLRLLAMINIKFTGQCLYPVQ